MSACTKTIFLHLSKYFSITFTFHKESLVLRYNGLILARVRETRFDFQTPGMICSQYSQSLFRHMESEIEDKLKRRQRLTLRELQKHNFAALWGNPEGSGSAVTHNGLINHYCGRANYT